jgi:hypothetical protein
VKGSIRVEEDVVMLDFLKSTGRRLRAGGFCPLALLALSGCALQAGGLTIPGAFDGGPSPRTSAVMCDIPKVSQPGSTRPPAVASAVKPELPALATMRCSQTTDSTPAAWSFGML